MRHLLRESRGYRLVAMSHARRSRLQQACGRSRRRTARRSAVCKPGGCADASLQRCSCGRHWCRCHADQRSRRPPCCRRWRSLARQCGPPCPTSPKHALAHPPDSYRSKPTPDPGRPTPRPHPAPHNRDQYSARESAVLVGNALRRRSVRRRNRDRVRAHLPHHTYTRTGTMTRCHRFQTDCPLAHRHRRDPSGFGHHKNEEPASSSRRPD